MSLFACGQCLSVENTETCNYWDQYLTQRPVCSACDPTIGKWHGHFERRPASGMLIGEDGFLYKEVPNHVKILGNVS